MISSIDVIRRFIVLFNRSWKKFDTLIEAEKFALRVNGKAYTYYLKKMPNAHI